MVSSLCLYTAPDVSYLATPLPYGTGVRCYGTFISSIASGLIRSGSSYCTSRVPRNRKFCVLFLNLHENISQLLKFICPHKYINIYIFTFISIIAHLPLLSALLGDYSALFNFIAWIT